MIAEAQQLPNSRLFYYPVWKKLICLFPVIAGCAMIETKPVGVSIIVTEPVAITENTFSTDFGLIGRISVRDDNQRFSGGVRWQHAGLNDEIFLLSPLGQVMVEIVQDKEGARLTTSEQKVFFASDIEILSEEVLGWRIPVAGLQYWVQGEHFPATVAIKHLDSEGRAVAINQDGWEINYTSYFSAQSVQPARPRVLVLNYEALRIKLVVDNWEAGQPVN